MSAKTFGWKTALITGGAGGLGRAMAVEFIKEGKEVILLGRTESNLKATTQAIGAKAYYVADVGNLPSLNAVAARIIKEHPEIDCLINNAGIMKMVDFTKPTEEDETKWTDEVNVNILGLVKLCSLFSTHLQTKPNAAIMNITSGLAYVPWHPNPIYCATKAFVKSFTLTLRIQLKDTSVNVIEIGPPLTESDLVREHKDASLFTVAKNPRVMSQEAFIKEVFDDLKAGHNEIGAGHVKEKIRLWRQAYDGQVKGLNPNEPADWSK